jgi:hypothetical protein
LDERLEREAPNDAVGDAGDVSDPSIPEDLLRSNDLSDIAANTHYPAGTIVNIVVQVR